MPCTLNITMPNGTARTLPIAGNRMTVGRSAKNDVQFEDAGLSREHFVLEYNAADWTVTDLCSRNGTYVNGTLVTGPHVLRSGDRVTAGRFIFDFFKEEPKGEPPPAFVIVDEGGDCLEISTATDLTGALDRIGASSADDLRGRRQWQAVVRAGKELAERKPRPELFQTIMDLVIDAVHAPRGLLLMVEAGGLVARAAKGQRFRLSGKVAERVLEHKESILVPDVAVADDYKDEFTIIGQQIRSILAVPLQTDQRVLGLLYLDSPHRVRNFDTQDLDLLTVMANIAAVHVEHARLAEIEAKERQIQADLRQAWEIQQNLLPTAPPIVEGLQLAGHSRPCRTVGGDYYDFVDQGDGRTCIIVADVAGKGLPAALVMSNLHARVEILFEQQQDLASTVAQLNRMTCKHSAGRRFITFFAGVIDAKSGAMTYCNAGHNPPLLVRSEGKIERLTDGGMILGVVPGVAYQQGTARLAPGDVLVLFSDGVTEALHPVTDDEFGEGRVGSVAAVARQGTAEEIRAAITEELLHWIGNCPSLDDLTLVVAKKT
jgi:serine phosphatase RsbU (regulator of sigma subunit)